VISVESLVAAGIGPTQARLFEAPLAAACARYAIDTPARAAAFVAQCAHESRLFTALEEGLWYRTPERICAIFPSSVPSVAIARTLACNPKLLANRVYANRNGNGNEQSGDGWRYRGRGLIQLTGRANYAQAASGAQRPYLDEPDLLLAADDACLAAAWFWQAHRLSALADAGRFDAITRAINGPAMATVSAAPKSRERSAPTDGAEAARSKASAKKRQRAAEAEPAKRPKAAKQAKPAKLAKAAKPVKAAKKAGSGKSKKAIQPPAKPRRSKVARRATA
jgi:putative chitinase